MRIKTRLSKIDAKIRNMLDNITRANRDSIDTRVGELTIERQRLERKLETLQQLARSQIECRELIAETSTFVDSLGQSLTQGPLERRQAVIRRCLDHIVIDRDKGELRITLRTLPAASGGAQLAAATQTVLVSLDASPPGLK